MTRDPHEDFLGQELKIGNIAVGSDGFDSMTLYRIIGTSPKMIRVEKVKAKYTVKSKLVYGKALLKVDDQTVTMYMLKYGY